MNAELLTGVIGIGGAFLGASGAVAANLLAGRLQLRQTREQQIEARHVAWVAEQRAACAEFLSAVNSFQNSCRELCDELDKKPQDLTRADAIYYDRYAVDWRNAYSADARVKLHCPKEVSDAANEVWEVIDSLERVCRLWFDAVRGGQMTRKWDAFHTANSAVEPKVQAFADAAQAALRPPSEPATR